MAVSQVGLLSTHRAPGRRSISPEAISDPGKVDARGDLYALGAVGYFLLTGRPVFGGESVVVVCSHHLHTMPEPPAQRLGRPLPEGSARDPGERPRGSDAAGGAHPTS